MTFRFLQRVTLIISFLMIAVMTAQFTVLGATPVQWLLLAIADVALIILYLGRET